MDDAVLAVIAELRAELGELRRQVALDITDLQGAVAELAEDFDRRRLRPAKQQ